jgi:hypothetical protein
MITPILISIISPIIIAAPWFLGSKVLNIISEPVALILSGLVLIGLANIGRNKVKKNQLISCNSGRKSIKSGYFNNSYSEKRRAD